ncbi:MAG: TonB-dependent receptor [Bacteroidetes bacterium]|nr:TonB-dependent receptor [Bacteroidota bacterium]
MKKILVLTYLTFTIISLSGQTQDSLKREIELNEVIVTATRTYRQANDLPVQTNVISAKMIQNFPVLNIDDVLKTTANVFVNRSWGIFSKNAAVTMRGLESSDRTLILIDGLPKNRLAGGSVNWHNINSDQIEKIEIIKGPASALYGNNAMGGVINIITKKPQTDLSGNARVFYGSHNTIGGSVSAAGRNFDQNKGFYWQVNGNYRRGDGYIFELPEYLDETDAKTKLDEGGGSLKLGYQFNEHNTVEIALDHYQEKRGAGRQVYAPDGSFDEYLTNTFRIASSNLIAGGLLQSTIYYSAENYYGQKESFNDSKEYKLLDAYTDREDMGLMSNWSKRLSAKHLLTAGLEVKAGTMKSHEIYRTSPDEIEASSKMIIYGIYLQDEIKLSPEKWQLIAGIRTDFSNFFQGWQNVTNPTKSTGFEQSFYEDFPETSWSALSPKISLQYQLIPQLETYVSVGTGFKPAKLKDLSQSGKINKGFRLANPNVKPEYLTNFEWGFHYDQNEKFSLSGAIYHSIGRDFQYSIGTGDSVDTGGNSLKPVILTDNVAEISVTGGELSMHYLIHPQLLLQASYSYNNSVITSYTPNINMPDYNLSGKKMTEVPPQLFYAGIFWQNNYFNLNVNCSYIDEQWFDIENTIKIDSWYLINARVSHLFAKKYEIYIDIQDLLDNPYVDRKGQLSPGRFIIGGINFQF